jgi:galactose oxidase-like protein
MRVSPILRLLLGAAIHASMALAQSPGTFTATGKMITPRFLHTATLLLDGRVLIAGGDSSYAASTSAEASAELYDPVTGTFAATGSMTAPRDGHTATLLPNGKVLIAGGGPRINGGGYSVASAELYDPATGTFAATGSMTVERTFHTATLLNNGKVLIAGGLRRAVGGPASDVSFPVGAELYDAATGTFAATGDMNEPFSDTATLLPNGKVLITRGIVYDPPNGSGSENFVRHAELYDPTTGTFTFTGDTITFHSGPTATLLMNGKVLIAGGDIGDGDGASVSAELYDPAAGTFAATGTLTTGREQNATTLLPDSTVLFAGGHGGVPVPGGGYDNLASAEIYDPARGAFSAAGAMITGRDILGATLLNNGKVLITGGNEYYPFGAGGRDPQHPVVSIAELYTPPVLLLPPVLLSLSGDGRGQGAILHASTHQLVSAENPAAAGEPLEIYLTGLTDGSVIPPQVAIGGRLAEVLFFGKAPGFAGLNQINVRVPSGLTLGSAVSVRLNYLAARATKSRLA